MSQHPARHLYLTWRWAARTTSAWPGEVAVCGVRLGTVATGSAMPDMGSGTVDLQSFLINDSSASGTTTHLTKTQAWAGDSGGTVNVTDGDQDAIAEACWTFNSTMSSFLTSQYTLQDIRLYAIGDNGKMVGNGPVLYTPTSTLNGGSAVSWLPQVAIAATLQTAAPGRKGHGRFYVGPFSTSQMGTDGLIGASFRPTFLGAVQTYLNAIRAIGSIASTRYYPVVYHRGTTTGAVVRNVRLGDEWDTQQRRRRQRAETYTSLSLS